MKKKIGVALPVIGTAIFAEELYRYIFCRKQSAILARLLDSKGHEDGYYAARDAAAAYLRQLPHEEYTLYSSRGQKLKGYYYPCGSGGKKIVFMVHGYRSEHADTAGLYYEYYHSRGIDVFCCDHTAAGNSEGCYIGFDVLETQDCLSWIRFLRRRFGRDVQIILHGFSMGAATVMQMSSHCPSNVKFIIEDSGYVSARASLDHQIGPLYGPLRRINKIVAGYDLNDSDVTASLQKSKIPMLFVHGQQDELVPFENGAVLYELYEGPKECFFPQGAKHIESMYVEPEKYAAKIDEFVKRYLK